MGEEQQQFDWFPRTKLHPPLAARIYLDRPRLTTALRQELANKKLTLVSAPAGTGKTTVLASLFAADPHQKMGWLSLDAHDNDPARFLTVFLAALERVVQPCCQNAMTVLSGLADPGADLHRVIGVLINEVLETDQDSFVLVLDDLHVIHEARVFGALDYLLEHMPQSMHLAAATRHDPPLALARLRGRGQLAEFRQSDLSFTRDEVDALTKQQLGLDLPASEIAALHHHSGGWAVALRLLAASLPQGADRADLAGAIAQSGRTERELFQFLAEEVLNQQSADTQQFMLQTAILPELNSHLCNAVTGREDADVELQLLYRRNLLQLIPAAGSGQQKDRDQAAGLRAGGQPSYQYHSLFAEFLRDLLVRLYPNQLTELHRRAAMAQSDPGLAVEHYLAARLWDESALAIERSAESMLYRGALDTLQHWIEMVPEPVAETHPRLSYYLGAIACERGDYVNARAPLEKSLESFELLGDEVGQGESLMLLGDVASGLKDLSRARELMDKALEYPLPSHRKTFLHISRVWVSVYSGAWDEVASGVAAAIETAQQSTDPRSLTGLALQLRALLIFTPGGMDRLEHHCQWVLAHNGDGVGPVQAGAHTLLGTIYLLRGRVEEGLRSTLRAQSLSQRLGGFVYMDVELAISHSVHYLFRRDFRGLEAAWNEQRSLFEEDAIGRQWLPCHLFILGRALWLQKRLAELREIYSRMLSTERPNDLPENIVVRTTMGALLALAEGQHAVAESALREASFLQQRVPYTQLFVNLRLLLAHFYLQSNRTEEALSELRSCLAENQRLGMPGLTLVEGESALPLLRLAVERKVQVEAASALLDILRQADQVRPVPVPTTGETLTPRQVEVLSLISAGASNRDIAQRLVISEWTVKSHVSEILAKLDVSSRTQAVARARELQLL